jgi:hypothetical protein
LVNLINQPNIMIWRCLSNVHCILETIRLNYRLLLLKKWVKTNNWIVSWCILGNTGLETLRSLSKVIRSISTVNSRWIHCLIIVLLLVSQVWRIMFNWGFSYFRTRSLNLRRLISHAIILISNALSCCILTYCIWLNSFSCLLLRRWICLNRDNLFRMKWLNNLIIFKNLSGLFFCSYTCYLSGWMLLTFLMSYIFIMLTWLSTWSLKLGRSSSILLSFLYILIWWWLVLWSNFSVISLRLLTCGLEEGTLKRGII